MKKVIVFLSIFSLLILCFTRCIKDEFNFDNWNREVKYDADFAVPIAYGDLDYTNIDDLANGIKNIEINEEGYLSIVYKKSISSIDISEKFPFDDQAQTKQYPISDFSTKGTKVSLEKKELWTINHSWNTSAKLTKMEVFKGNLQYQIKSENGTLSEPVSGHINFPDIKVNGTNVLSIVFSNVTLPHEGTINLENYVADLTKGVLEGGLGYDQVRVEILFNIAGTPSFSGDIGFSLAMTNIEYKRLEGNFGYNELIYNGDSVDIELFKEGDYYINRYWFEDPKIKIHYKNSYGVPTKFGFEQITMYTDGGATIGTPTGIGVPIIPNWKNIDHATNVGTVAKGDYIINKTNSNINELVAQRPRWLSFVAKGATDEISSSLNNFIDKNSRLDIDVVIEMPMWGDMYAFKYSDTAEFKLPEVVKKYDPVKKANLKIDITNGFPAEMLGQIYFLDENNNILDSLLVTEQTKILKAAKVGANDRVTEASHQATYVQVTNEKINKWDNAKKIIYKAVANTTDVNPPSVIQKVKVYPENNVKFRIGLDFEVGIQGNIDSIMDAIKDTVKIN